MKLAPKAHLLTLPAELRLRLYSDVLSDVEAEIKTLRLDTTGRPARHPLARACRQTHAEFQHLYEQTALGAASTIHATARNYDFSALTHLLDLSNVTTNDEKRHITIKIIVDRTLDDGDEEVTNGIIAWLEQCSENMKRPDCCNARIYSVTFTKELSIDCDVWGAMRHLAERDGVRMYFAAKAETERQYWAWLAKESGDA